MSTEARSLDPQEEVFCKPLCSLPLQRYQGIICKQHRKNVLLFIKYRTSTYFPEVSYTIYCTHDFLIAEHYGLRNTTSCCSKEFASGNQKKCFVLLHRCRKEVQNVWRVIALDRHRHSFGCSGRNMYYSFHPPPLPEHPNPHFYAPAGPGSSRLQKIILNCTYCK
jgi:hypothetical protein